MNRTYEAVKAELEDFAHRRAAADPCSQEYFDLTRAVEVAEAELLLVQPKRKGRFSLTPHPATANEIVENMARELVNYADSKGLVVTIGLVPTQPLKMGGYTEVIDVREKRVAAEPIHRPMVGCTECTDEPECAWHQTCQRKDPITGYYTDRNRGGWADGDDAPLPSGVTA